MDIERSDSLSQAFVLEPDNLKALCEKLGKFVDVVLLQIDCKDKFTRKFDNVSELLEYENTAKNEIETLRLIGVTTTTLPMFIAAVTFHQAQGRNVYLSIKGDGIKALEANRVIETSLEGMKPWYDFVARRDFSTILCFFGFIVLMSFVIRDAVRGEPSSLSFSTLTAPQITVLLFFCAAVMFATIVLVEGLNRLKKKAFPMAVFAIGNGATRHKNKEVIRIAFIAGFFVSIAASLVFALLSLPML
jgi:hypothetical protein